MGDGRTESADWTIPVLPQKLLPGVADRNPRAKPSGERQRYHAVWRQPQLGGSTICHHIAFLASSRLGGGARAGYPRFRAQPLCPVAPLFFGKLVPFPSFRPLPPSARWRCCWAGLLRDFPASPASCPAATQWARFAPRVPVEKRCAEACQQRRNALGLLEESATCEGVMSTGATCEIRGIDRSD